MKGSEEILARPELCNILLEANEEREGANEEGREPACNHSKSRLDSISDRELLTSCWTLEHTGEEKQLLLRKVLW